VHMYVLSIHMYAGLPSLPSHFEYCASGSGRCGGIACPLAAGSGRQHRGRGDLIPVGLV